MIGNAYIGRGESDYHTMKTTKIPQTLVVIGNDYIGRGESDYHTITATTIPRQNSIYLRVEQQ